VTQGLQLHNLSAGYNGNWVVQGLHLHCPPGVLLHVEGNNGDGRSTLLKAIMGLCDRAGELLFDGQSLTSLAPWQIARLGIGYAPEQRDVFRGLSVAEHFRLAQLAARQEPPPVTTAELLQALPVLKARWHQSAHLLSGGEQKMLALARAMIIGTRMILLDEPCEGLSESAQADVLQCLNQMAQRKVIVLLTGALSQILRQRIVQAEWRICFLKPS
jgi:branched-chain amino acid transport system ATP-binding protein